MFYEADIMFKRELISMLKDSIVDEYMGFPMGKEMWDTLKAKLEVSDADNELYVM